LKASHPWILHDLGTSREHIALLRQMYASIYSSEFLADERESLENMERYLELREEGWYGRNNYHILVATAEDGRPVAAAILDYLEEANAGMLEFLVVARRERGRGLGKWLLDASEAVLERDAREKTGRSLDWIAGEMEDPFLVPPIPLSEAEPGQLDPVARARVWSRWGYRRLRFPYIQPALSSEQNAVENLLLIGKLQRSDYLTQGVPSSVVKSVLHGYMRWAMRIENPEDQTEYRRMAEWLEPHERVASVRLLDYIGENPSIPLETRAIEGPDDPDLAGVSTLYSQCFAAGPTALDPTAFEELLRRREARDDHRWHLWSLRAFAGDPVGGLASFFSFPGAGFAGFVALAPPLRGQGRLRQLLARMEIRMLSDFPDVQAMYLECNYGDPVVGVFRKVGFREINVDYCQPLLPMAAAQGNHASRLHLLYKPLGDVLVEPVLHRDNLLADVKHIFRVVYEVPHPAAHPAYRALEHASDRWLRGRVPWLER
jgi:GNAT superfamily N-acetyltransferase